MQSGEIKGIVPKSYIPNYGEFYEGRWFKSGKNIKSKMDDITGNIPFGSNLIFRLNDCKFGIEICEDLWSPIPPSSSLSLAGAEIIFNLSASNELVGKNEYLKSLISNQSARCICGYVYSSAGYGESSTDLVFVPKGFIYENGSLIGEISNRFEKSTDYKYTVNQIDLNGLS